MSIDVCLKTSTLNCFLLTAVFVMLASFTMTYGAVGAAALLHRTMLDRIFRAPMAFFDTTPLGRIINRFRFAVLINQSTRLIQPRDLQLHVYWLLLLTIYGLASGVMVPFDLLGWCCYWVLNLYPYRLHRFCICEDLC